MNPLKFITDVPWSIGSLIAIGLFIIFAIIGLLITRKVIDHGRLKSHNDVGGFVFANLGVLYSVLLGFTVVNVQQRFDKIKETTQIEASYVSELYRDSAVFSEADRKTITDALRKYTQSVIDHEWQTMSNGFPDDETVQTLHAIWSAYYNVTLTDKKQEIWYNLSVDKLNALMSARLKRVLGSEESLGTEMWTMLIILGIVIVTFVWFFGLESRRTHMTMVATVAATTAFLLFLIYSLDTSFSGDVSVTPEAFERVLRAMN